MGIPTTDAERQQHIALCVGCSLINEAKPSGDPWVTCYEHRDRNVSAIKKLIELYKFDQHAENYNMPMVEVNGTLMVNLHSLVDDIAARFERGTLIAGETRVRNS